MIIRTISSEITVTPEIAKRFIQENSMKHQRNLVPQNIARLTDLMKKEEFYQTTFRFCEWNGKTYVVDGHHTLHAIQKSGMAQKVLILTYEVDDEKDIQNLYTGSDPYARSIRDKIRSLNLEQETGLSAHQLAKTYGAAVGIRLWFGNDKKSVWSHEIRDTILEQASCAIQFFSSISGCKKSYKDPLVRKPVMAVALMTFRHQPQKAYAFWHGIAMNSGLEGNDPRQGYLEYLISTTLEGGSTTISSKKPTSSVAQLKAACYAWNAWAKGRKLRSFKVPEEPVWLWGTPHRKPD